MPLSPPPPAAAAAEPSPPEALPTKEDVEGQISLLVERAKAQLSPEGRGGSATRSVKTPGTAGSARSNGTPGSGGRSRSGTPSSAARRRVEQAELLTRRELALQQQRKALLAERAANAQRDLAARRAEMMKREQIRRERLLREKEERRAALQQKLAEERLLAGLDRESWREAKRAEIAEKIEQKRLRRLSKQARLESQRQERLRLAAEVAAARQAESTAAVAAQRESAASSDEEAVAAGEQAAAAEGQYEREVAQRQRAELVAHLEATPPRDETRAADVAEAARRSAQRAMQRAAERRAAMQSEKEINQRAQAASANAAARRAAQQQQLDLARTPALLDEGPVRYGSAARGGAPNSEGRGSGERGAAAQGDFDRRLAEALEEQTEAPASAAAGDSDFDQLLKAELSDAEAAAAPSDALPTAQKVVATEPPTVDVAPAVETCAGTPERRLSAADIARSKRNSKRASKTAGGPAEVKGAGPAESTRPAAADLAPAGMGSPSEVVTELGDPPPPPPPDGAAAAGATAPVGMTEEKRMAWEDAELERLEEQEAEERRQAAETGVANASPVPVEDLQLSDTTPAPSPATPAMHVGGVAETPPEPDRRMSAAELARRKRAARNGGGTDAPVPDGLQDPVKDDQAAEAEARSAADDQRSAAAAEVQHSTVEAEAARDAAEAERAAAEAEAERAAIEAAEAQRAAAAEAEVAAQEAAEAERVAAEAEATREAAEAERAAVTEAERTAAAAKVEQAALETAPEPDRRMSAAELARRKRASRRGGAPGTSAADGLPCPRGQEVERVAEAERVAAAEEVKRAAEAAAAAVAEAERVRQAQEEAEALQAAAAAHEREAVELAKAAEAEQRAFEQIEAEIRREESAPSVTEPGDGPQEPARRMSAAEIARQKRLKKREAASLAPAESAGPRASHASSSSSASRLSFMKEAAPPPPRDSADSGNTDDGSRDPRGSSVSMLSFFGDEAPLPRSRNQSEYDVPAFEEETPQPPPTWLVNDYNGAVLQLELRKRRGNVGLTFVYAKDAARAPLVVATVVAGGPAAQAGCQPGDRFLEVNGTNLRTVARSAALQVISNIPDGSNASVMVAREPSPAPVAQRKSAAQSELRERIRLSNTFLPDEYQLRLAADGTFRGRVGLTILDERGGLLDRVGLQINSEVTAQQLCDEIARRLGGHYEFLEVGQDGHATPMGPSQHVLSLVLDWSPALAAASFAPGDGAFGFVLQRGVKAGRK